MNEIKDISGREQKNQNMTQQFFTFEDFIADYPDQEDPEIQDKLTRKREFNELVPDRVEKLITRGQLYRHQELYYRIFKNYDRSLIMDRTGTGKTCEIIAIAEYLKNLYKEQKLPIDEFPHITKVFFLVKGPNIEAELRNQLVYKCTPEGTYDSENVLTAKTNKHKENLITRGIEDWYVIEKFQAFANLLSKKTDAQIIDEYSGSMVFIDEAHYLKTEAEIAELELDYQNLAEQEIKDSKTPEITESEIKSHPQNFPTTFAQQVEDDLQSQLSTQSLSKKPETNIYKQVHRFVHLIKRSKIYLATATPMINHPSEMASIMNLLNPLDRQLSHLSIDWRTVDHKTLEPYFRGKVSYVRELDTGIQLIENGQAAKIFFITQDSNVLQSQVILHSTVMSDFQAASYNRARITKHVDKNNNLLKSSFYLDELAACNFVFPDGTWGGDFKEKRVAAAEGKQRTVKGIATYTTWLKNDEFEPTPEFSRYLKDINNIRKSSSKYYDTVVRYSSRYNKTPNPGSAFIYSDIKSGSGIYILSLCFGAHGFDRFLDSISAFEYDAITNQRKIKFNIKPILRYALITGDTPPARRSAILELFNSYENRYGDYIKILLGSEVTQAAINFNNVQNFELETAGWHMSGTYQAMSRILRATSHEILISELPAGERLKVNIYRHCAHTQEQYQNFLEKSYNFFDILRPGIISTDLYLYMISEDKDLYIKRIEHFAIQDSSNYFINYYRNHRPQDKDYTPICFYEKCDQLQNVLLPLTSKTIWDGLKDEKNDFSTYDLYYSDEVIAAITVELISLFQRRSSYDLFELSDSLFKFPLRYLIKTINSLTQTKKIFYNRLGLPGYLHYLKNLVFWSSDYSDGDPYYSENTLILNQYNLENYILNTDQNKIIRIQNVLDPTKIQQIWINWSKLNISEKSEVLERSITARINDPNLLARSSPEALIYTQFRYLVYWFKLPTNALQKAKVFYDQILVSGRKKIDLQYKRFLPDLDFNITNGAMVITHIMYNLDNTTNYKVNTAYRKVVGKIRILMEGRWRDLTPWEVLVYRYMIDYTNQFTIQGYQQAGIYGIIPQADIFLVRDPSNRGGGKACHSYHRSDLFNFLYQTKYQLDLYSEKEDDGKSIDEYKSFLAEHKFYEKYLNGPIDRVIYFYNFVNSGTFEVPDLCKILEDHLDEIGLLYRHTETVHEIPILINSNRFVSEELEDREEDEEFKEDGRIETDLREEFVTVRNEQKEESEIDLEAYI